MSRDVPWRRKVPGIVQERMQQVGQCRFFLVKEAGPTSVVLKDDCGQTFKVFIGHRHACSCASPGRAGGGGPMRPPQEDLCLHILFVLLRVYKIPADNPLSWQQSLTDSEIDKILSQRANRAVPQVRHPASSSSARAGKNQGVARKPIGDSCPICCEDMHEKQPLVPACLQHPLAASPLPQALAIHPADAFTVQSKNHSHGLCRVPIGALMCGVGMPAQSAEPSPLPDTATAVLYVQTSQPAPGLNSTRSRALCTVAHPGPAAQFPTRHPAAHPFEYSPSAGAAWREAAPNMVDTVLRVARLGNTSSAAPVTAVSSNPAPNRPGGRRTLTANPANALEMVGFGVGQGLLPAGPLPTSPAPESLGLPLHDGSTPLSLAVAVSSHDVPLVGAEPLLPQQGETYIPMPAPSDLPSPAPSPVSLPNSPEHSISVHPSPSANRSDTALVVPPVPPWADEPVSHSPVSLPSSPPALNPFHPLLPLAPAHSPVSLPQTPTSPALPDSPVSLPPTPQTPTPALPACQFLLQPASVPDLPTQWINLSSLASSPTQSGGALCQDTLPSAQQEDLPPPLQCLPPPLSITDLSPPTRVTASSLRVACSPPPEPSRPLPDSLPNPANVSSTSPVALPLAMSEVTHAPDSDITPNSNHPSRAGCGCPLASPCGHHSSPSGTAEVGASGTLSQQSLEPDPAGTDALASGIPRFSVPSVVSLVPLPPHEAGNWDSASPDWQQRATDSSRSSTPGSNPDADVARSGWTPSALDMLSHISPGPGGGWSSAAMDVSGSPTAGLPQGPPDPLTSRGAQVYQEVLLPLSRSSSSLTPHSLGHDHVPEDGSLPTSTPAVRHDPGISGLAGVTGNELDLGAVVDQVEVDLLPQLELQAQRLAEQEEQLSGLGANGGPLVGMRGLLRRRSDAYSSAGEDDVASLPQLDPASLAEQLQ
eukprot:gene6572-1173_t